MLARNSASRTSARNGSSQHGYLPFPGEFLRYYYNRRTRLFLNLPSTTQLSLAPSQFYQATDKFLLSFIKDGKKVNPDFELLNELYVVTLGDNFAEKEENSLPVS
jgi:hypothetical protein